LQSDKALQHCYMCIIGVNVGQRNVARIADILERRLWDYVQIFLLQFENAPLSTSSGAVVATILRIRLSRTSDYKLRHSQDCWKLFC